MSPAWNTVLSQPHFFHLLILPQWFARLFRYPPNPAPTYPKVLLVHLFFALLRHSQLLALTVPIPTNRECQTVFRPPDSVPHHRFSHKGYYQNGAEYLLTIIQSFNDSPINLTITKVSTIAWGIGTTKTSYKYNTWPGNHPGRVSVFAAISLKSPILCGFLGKAKDRYFDTLCIKITVFVWRRWRDSNPRTVWPVNWFRVSLVTTTSIHLHAVFSRLCGFPADWEPDVEIVDKA